MPLWRQLLVDLRARLDAGEFTAGFPTEARLHDEYGLSRHTIRTALAELNRDGVLSRIRGRGTSVRPPRIEQPWGQLHSFFRLVERQGHEQRSEVLKCEEVFDADAAKHLLLPVGSGLVRLERLRLAGGQPLAHDVTWMPAYLTRRLLDVDLTHVSLYDALEDRCGVRPDHGTERVTATLPPTEIRAAMGLSAQQPVFVVTRLGYAGDEPIEWRTTHLRCDCFSFVVSGDCTP